MWVSDDQGESWQLVDQLTTGSEYNQSYVRRPLDAHEDFYALWSDGDAWDPSLVNLYFTTRDGTVYRMPDAFEPGAAFAAPILVPEPALGALLSSGALLLLRRRG